ncbi:DUF461 domain-containing protein [Streptomyces laurentii]|uniref:DUF461 domain-containing protein n=1 Tax=Streptomyces laurentii TaxID=39478 RepID=UPI003674115B
MSRSLRRGALAATALVISVASLSACGAGNDAQTLGIRPDNAGVSVDDIKVLNVLVITQPEHGAEGPAVVSATLFNNGDKQQTLESITLPGTSATVKLAPAKGTGPVVVPAGGSTLLGGAGNASATIENGREAGKNGSSQPVVFKLSKTGEAKVNAFVVPAASYFKEFGPSAIPAVPTATATPTGTATTPAAPTGTATPGSTAGPTGEATHAAGH